MATFICPDCNLILRAFNCAPKKCPSCSSAKIAESPRAFSDVNSVVLDSGNKALDKLHVHVLELMKQ